MTDEGTEARIVVLYLSGMSRTQIASEVKVTTANISKVLRGCGIEPQQTRRVRCDEQTKDRVAELYRSGSSESQITAEVGISLSTVSNILKDRGVAIRRTEPIRYDEQTQDRVVAMYTAGLTQGQVREEIGISAAAVSKILKSRGVKTRPNPSVRCDEQTVAKIIELYATGISQTSVATEVGVAVMTVSKILRRHGVEIRGARSATLPTSAR